MRRFYLLLGAVVLLLAGQGRAQVETPVVHSVDPFTASCQGTDEPCLDWLRFREATSGPYQAFGVVARPGRATVIISEPFAPRTELLELVDALFGSSLANRTYRRWVTGLDGWLEDLVLDVRLDGVGTTSVFSGHDLARWEAPAQVVDRLLFLYAALHGTTDGFSVDDVARFPGTPTVPKVAAPTVVAADLLDWLYDGTHRWRPVTASASSPVTFASIAMLRRPAVHARDDGSLMLLSIPPKTALEALAEPFRQFAVASDFLLGSHRVSNGTTVLLGRMRQLPFTTLPPLRFETFASFVRYRSTELAQSYERQRIFAGRVLQGPFAGWDWAPVLLSSQLDDSEFGTLLNQADQILKSWSQAGTVNYYGFAYAKPRTFPFGRDSASGYFATALGTSSLVFNWNTEAFSTIHEAAGTELLTIDRFGALPILYLPAGQLGDTIPTAASGNVAEIRHQVRSSQASRTETVARAAALSARDYFADRGDPILTRVAQNVLLHQTVQAFLENVVTTRPQPPPARWEAVSLVLRDEATSWLRRVAAPGFTSGMSRVAEGMLEQTLRESSLTIEQLAETLAMPQVTAARLAAVAARYERSRIRQKQLVEAYDPAYEIYRLAFIAFCKAVGGTLSMGGTSCQYTSSHYGSIPHQTLEAAESHLKRIDAEIESLSVQLAKSGEELQRLDRIYARATELGRVVAREAAFTSALDRILERARASVSGVPAASIRTPGIVLSRNPYDESVIGGHNVSFAPLREVAVRTRLTPKGPPSIRTRGTAAATAAAAALHTTRPGTLLDEMRLTLNRQIDGRLMEDLTTRVRSCACDALIVRSDRGEIFYLRNSTTTPVVHRLAGTSEVVDVLARPPAASVVRFDGFSEAPHIVESIARSVQLAGQVGAAEASALKRLAALAGKWFGTTPMTAPFTTPQLYAYSRAGRPPEVLRVFSDTSAGRILNGRASWQTATVKAGEIGTAASGRPATATYVHFGPRPNQRPIIQTIQIEVEVAEGRKPIPLPQLQKIIKSTLLTTRPGTAPTVAAGIIELRRAIQKQMTPEEINFFLQSGEKPIRVSELREATPAIPGMQ